MSRRAPECPNLAHEPDDVDAGAFLDRFCRVGAFSAPEWVSVLNQIGRMVRPKVGAALVAEEQGHIVFGLYTQDQGRRPGRMSDFSAVHRVGGLVVDRTEAPAQGVFEVVHDVDAPPNTVIWPWPAKRAIRTDGWRWRVMVEDGAGAWGTHEAFDVTPPDTRTGDISPGVQTALAEFLRRGLLPNTSIPNLSILAQRLASHARAQAETWVDGWDGRRQIADFQRIFQNELGLTLSTPTHAARTRAAVNTLAAIHSALVLSQQYCIIQDYHCAGGFLEPLTPMTMDDISRFASAWSIHAPSDTLDDFILVQDRLLTDFLREFLAELGLTFDGRRELRPERWRSINDQTRNLLAAQSDDLANCAIVDPNAGIGDYLLTATLQLAEDGKPIQLSGAETHPVALRVAALRLDMALGILAHHDKLREKPQIELWAQNIFRDGSVREFARSGKVKWLGEVRPHVGKGERLDIGGPRAESGRGGRITGVEHAAERLLAAAEQGFSSGGLSVACLRLPITWAGNDEFADARARLQAEMKSLELYINTGEAGERPRDRRLAHGEATLWLQPHHSAVLLPEGYRRIDPRSANRHSWLPAAAEMEYDAWLPLTAIAAHRPWNGPVERRGLTLIDIDKSRLLTRLDAYFGGMPDDFIAEMYPPMMRSTARFPASATRHRLREEGFFPDRVMTYSFRPFDDRYIYTHNARPLFSEPANELFSLAGNDNFFLVATTGDDRATVGALAWWGSRPCDYDFFAGHSGHFPVWIKSSKHSGRIANLSDAMRDYLRRLGYRGSDDPDHSRATAMIPWLHALAVLHTDIYRVRYRERLRHGWPRIPFPGFADETPPAVARERLEASAELGRRIAALLSGQECPLGASIGGLGRFRVKGELVDHCHADASDRLMRVEWGVMAKGNTVRPSKGSIKEYGFRDKDLELLAVEQGDKYASVFGGLAYDVWLNSRSCWSSVPEKVWRHHLCGRQVLPKWLSYRGEEMINRPLTPDEIDHFTQIVRTVAQLLLIEAELDREWERLRQLLPR